MAVVGDHDEVLDPDPELARQVDARLDGDDVARLEHVVGASGPGAAPRGPRARRRGRARGRSARRARRRDHRARGLVGLLAADPGPIASRPAGLGGAHELVDLARRARRSRRRRRSACSPSSSRRASRPCPRRRGRRRAISRSEGSACGSAPFAPAPTIAGNDGSRAELADPRLRRRGRRRARCARQGPPRGRTRRPRRRAAPPRRSPPARPRPCGGAAARPGRRRRPARPPSARLLLELAQVGDAGRRVVEADPAARAARRARAAAGCAAITRSKAAPTSCSAPLGVAEVGDEDRGSRGPTSASPLVPVKPVSQRMFGDRVGPGVAGADEVADDQLVEPLLGDQRRRAARRAPRSRSELLLAAAPAPRGSRRRPCRRSCREHEALEHRVPAPLLARRRRRRGGPRPPAGRRSRARRGSPSCSGSRRPG